MHVVARVLAVAYIALALFGAFVYAQMSTNYVNVTDVTVNVEKTVFVSAVNMEWSGNASDDATITVWVNATNPGRVAIEVLSVNFNFHMDDPNDLRFWFDPQKLDDTLIRRGGFNYGKGQGFVLQPGETQSMPSVVPIPAGTDLMATFDRPDPDGRYHPIVWVPTLVYTFVDFEFAQSIPVNMGPFYDARGVMPSG